ncbi:uncharacterized protein LOC9630927 [Selaginella moellendorffii]|uniref:uncharacterized protein LOC9630927 n=1 Tax=Selaginella moellendorffii TaxID=88036 RepID=UPI000D1CCA8A|nr:uncharacterized protein LOC9630927 [Selaginella moellendorffii]|eukprot:XP_024528266.1 uncharacterized protein LOC9630927 [Selaginella moellendorffii]
MAPKAAPTPSPPPPPPAPEPAAVEAPEAPPPEPTFTGTWFDDPVEGEAAQQAALELKNRIEIRALSVRQFLEKTVVPLLLQGMHHLVLERYVVLTPQSSYKQCTVKRGLSSLASLCFSSVFFCFASHCICLCPGRRIQSSI